MTITEPYVSPTVSGCSHDVSNATVLLRSALVSVIRRYLALGEGQMEVSSVQYRGQLSPVRTEIHTYNHQTIIVQSLPAKCQSHSAQSSTYPQSPPSETERVN